MMNIYCNKIKRLCLCFEKLMPRVERDVPGLETPTPSWIKQMTDRAEALKKESLSNVGIPANRMGSGLDQQLNQGNFVMQKSRGVGRKWEAFVNAAGAKMINDAFMDELGRTVKVEQGNTGVKETPQTLEELKEELNPDLIGAILALEES